MKKFIKYILNTVVSLASFIGGVYFCVLLILILIGLPGGDIPF
jgi:nitrate reductase NapE component